MDELTHVVISQHLGLKLPLVSEPMTERKATGIAAVLNALPDPSERLQWATVARIGSLTKYSDKAVNTINTLFDVSIPK